MARDSNQEGWGWGNFGWRGGGFWMEGDCGPLQFEESLGCDRGRGGVVDVEHDLGVARFGVCGEVIGTS
jgi:hypothetical protein